MLGSDLIPGLDKWTEGPEFILNTPCIVIHRRGASELAEEDLLKHPNYPKYNPVHYSVEESIVGIVSSTEVRRRMI